MTLIFCYKIPSVALVSPTNQPIFSVTRVYVHVLWIVREALVI